MRLLHQLLLVILPIVIVNDSFSQQQHVPRKPNIIVFLVDDMGWQDTSVPFADAETPLNKLYRTPAMQRLASQGVRFVNAYANPVCTPTRVSLITGTNATRHHVTQWTSPNKDKSTDHPDSVMNPVKWNFNGFSPEADIASTFHGTPLPSILKSNGYYTVHSGKAHFGSAGTPGSNPLNVGFDINIGGSEIGHPASYSGMTNFDKVRNGKSDRNAVTGLEKYHGKDVHLSDALTTEALEAIQKPINAGQPFFLYLAHYAVHTPIIPDERFAPRYRALGLDSIESAYASLIEGMDKSLGDVLNFLQRKRIDNNTIIIFTSDNGGLSRVPPRGGPQADVHNAPLRAGKGSVYEGGIRVPLIVKWPGRSKGGNVSRQPVIVEDLFPTILEMASANVIEPTQKTNGQQIKTIQQVDGKSFVRSVGNASAIDTTRTLIWHHPNRWIAGEGQLTAWAGAIRKGDWKLLYDYQKGKLELYNLRTDVGEQHDLARDRPSVTATMATLFTNELKRHDAQLPTFKDGTPVPYPDQLVKTLAAERSEK